VIYVCGPGHGGPAMVANTYLEGTYTEVYPHVTRDEAGMRTLFRQFSFPGGVSSHAAPETPGSINEGGELGYSLAHAYGAAFDNPDLVVACVIGDGEAETGPLAASWHSNKFLDPVRDGAVLPILHLNGYKIANPTVLARIPDDELVKLLEGYGHRVLVVEGDEPAAVHRALADTLDTAFDEIAAIQAAFRDGDGARPARPRWPMIVLHTPKGWTGPREVDGLRVEGTWRSHQVPLANLAEVPEHLELLERWMRSYRPEELFDANGTLQPWIEALAPEGDRRMGANPHANGGRLRRPLDLPDFRAYAVGAAHPVRRAGPRGRPAQGGQPPRQRRPAAAAARPGRLPGLGGRRRAPGPHGRGADTGAGPVAAGRRGRQPPHLPDHGPRRDGVEPPLGRVRGHRPHLGRPHRGG